MLLGGFIVVLVAGVYFTLLIIYLALGTVTRFLINPIKAAVND